MRAVILAALVAGTNLGAAAQAQELTPKYDFSLSREEKTKLAESAAPLEISGRATIYVLDRTGYLKAREGTNGFTCFVDRQAPVNLEPTCFDAEGSATTFLTRLFVEEERAKGVGEEAINGALADGYRTGRFRAPGKPGIVYMMSDQGFLLATGMNKLVAIPPHLMFYAPYASDKDIGSPPAVANMPRILRAGQPDAYIVVVPGTHGGH
jgi:hypothetical protein